MNRIGIGLLWLTAQACTSDEGVAGVATESGAEAPKEAAAPADGERLMPAEPAGVEAAKKTDLPLPADWKGTGVLEKRGDAPKGSPAWAKVVAEVIEEDGKRFLRTSGTADKIKNKALARSTAEARARAAMAKWTTTDKLVGSEIVDVWQKKKAGAARARIAVPPDWQPGTPVPSSP